MLHDTHLFLFCLAAFYILNFFIVVTLAKVTIAKKWKGWEPEERHFALWDGDALVACVVIRPLEGGAVKLRQMAVEPPRQGCGAGRRLLEGVEEQLRVEGVSRIELNARDTAAGFYRKLGYRKVGGEFVEVTIPHWKMVKRL